MADSEQKQQQEQQQKPTLAAAVLGYTGESGKELVKALAQCQRFTSVTLIGRRVVELPPEVQGAGKFEQRTVDFQQLVEDPEGHNGLFVKCDVAFCCLGTTRAKSGVDGFVKVDHDYIMAAAEAAMAAHVRQFHLISSSGADKSSMFLYQRIKGQVEENLSNLPFERVVIYRPKLLICDRQEPRPVERMARALAKPATMLFPTLFTTPTLTLAKAMVNAALINSGNRRDIYFNSDIFQLAARTDFDITK